MAKEIVQVGIGNESEKSMDVEDVKTWVPKKITYIRDVALFKANDTYYSMKLVDFKRIFNK